MFGIDFPNLMRFFVQLGAVTAGAASLWIFIFIIKKQWGLANVLILLFLYANLLFFFAWVINIVFIYPPAALAHEGLRLIPTMDIIAKGFKTTIPFVILLGMLNLLGIIAYFRHRHKIQLWLKKYGSLFFITQFFLWSIVISFSSNTGLFSIEQVSYFLHNWHSILTLGTVIAIDFLFIATLKDTKAKTFLYPFFPYMSAAIWTGLGLDFISSFLVFESVFSVTDQFLFTQAVIIIIIINGAMLSGKINSELIKLIKPDRVSQMAPSFEKVAGISGVISITSWFTITFIDFFELTASYYQLMGVYLAAIVLIYYLKPGAEAGIQKSIDSRRFELRV